MGFAVSGSNTASAADNEAIMLCSAATVGTGVQGAVGARFCLTGLNPGTTTFTAKYRTNTGTRTFLNRRIIVEPK
jgi:hypothetical protein